MYFIARRYLIFLRYFKRLFGIDLPGAGCFLRRIKSDRVLSVEGFFLYFDHRLAASYAHPILGDWTEPETIAFIKFIKAKVDGLAFINVGANTGEMCIAAAVGGSTKVFAFDPILECCEVVQKSLELNAIEDFEIFNCLVGEKECEVNFSHNLLFSGTSSVFDISRNASAELIRMVRLNDVFKNNELPRDKILMLIDVEGYELNVLRGSQSLFKLNPIIIFEYNTISKRHFSISDIKKLLGRRYEVYRLNSDAKLDSMVDEAWNCVAVPIDHAIFDSISSLVIK